MATNKKTSILVESQFPDFVRESGQNLIAFIKSYYEWMEQEGNPLDASKNLPIYQDIDFAPDKYFEFFEKEIMESIPHELIADRVLLAKNIRDLYRSRGSEQSFRLYFRMLFNEEIDVYYPGQDILRASDGLWIEEFVLKIVSVVGEASLLEGNTIRGLTSGARGRVQKINQVIEGGTTPEVTSDHLHTWDVTLTNVIGTFVDGETIESIGSDVSGVISDFLGRLISIDVYSGGAEHAVNDAVDFVSTIGSGATGRVTSISNTSALTFSITNGGSGYRLSDVSPEFPAGDPTSGSVSVIGGPGTDASFIVSSINNVEGANLNVDLIQSVENVVLNTGPQFDSLGTETPPISAALASANVSSTLISALTFANTEIGTIETITVINPGSGYSTLPIVSVIDEEIAIQGLSDGGGGIKGQNAVIAPAHVTGAIQTVSIDESTLISNYNSSYDVRIVNTSRTGTFDAFGTPEVSGIIEFPGRYADTRGWLSWNNRLQDNFYYQEFSYDIFSDNVVSAYSELVRRVLHPAGTKQFGRVRLHAEADIPLFEANTEVIIT